MKSKRRRGRFVIATACLVVGALFLIPVRRVSTYRTITKAPIVRVQYLLVQAAPDDREAAVTDTGLALLASTELQSTLMVLHIEYECWTKDRLRNFEESHPKLPLLGGPHRTDGEVAEWLRNQPVLCERE